MTVGPEVEIWYPPEGSWTLTACYGGRSRTGDAPKTAAALSRQVLATMPTPTAGGRTLNGNLWSSGGVNPAAGLGDRQIGPIPANAQIQKVWNLCAVACELGRQLLPPHSRRVRAILEPSSAPVRPWNGNLDPKRTNLGFGASPGNPAAPPARKVWNLPALAAVWGRQLWHPPSRRVCEDEEPGDGPMRRGLGILRQSKGTATFGASPGHSLLRLGKQGATKTC